MKNNCRLKHTPSYSPKDHFQIAHSFQGIKGIYQKPTWVCVWLFRLGPGQDMRTAGQQIKTLLISLDTYKAPVSPSICRRIISTIRGKGQRFLGIGLSRRFWSLMVGFRTIVAPTHQCRRCKRHRFGSLGQEDPLEEDTATHSSVLAWRIPWTEELGRLQSIWSQRIGHDWSDLPHTQA